MQGLSQGGDRFRIPKTIQINKKNRLIQYEDMQGFDVQELANRFKVSRPELEKELLRLYHLRANNLVRDLEALGWTVTKPKDETTFGRYTFFSPDGEFERVRITAENMVIDLDTGEMTLIDPY